MLRDLHESGFSSKSRNRGVFQGMTYSGFASSQRGLLKVRDQRFGFAWQHDFGQDGKTLFLN
jgi:hypothetical protein